jgi:hypothetical protein
LYVPRGPAREIRKDLRRAGIPQLPSGKVDFHALRAVYVSLVFEAGADVKQAQDLARLDTARVALETYARSRSAALRPLVETVWQQIAGEVVAEIVGAEMVQNMSAVGENPFISPALAACRRGDLNPKTGPQLADTSATKRPHLVAIPARTASQSSADLTASQHPDDIVPPLSGAESVHAVHRLIAAWPRLPPAIQAHILSLLPP